MVEGSVVAEVEVGVARVLLDGNPLGLGHEVAKDGSGGLLVLVLVLQLLK